MKEFFKYVFPYLLITGLVFIAKEADSGQWVFLLILPLLGLYYFLLDNPYKKHQTIISLLFIGWIISAVLQLEGITGLIVTKVIVGLLVIMYGLRFYRREDKHFVDYLKILAVIGYGVLSISSPKIGIPEALLIPVFILIYLLDRLIVRRQMSKTLQIITFCFMGLVMLTFLVYAQVKSNEADMQRKAAEANLIMARNVENTAEMRVMEFESQLQEQKKLTNQLKQELDECKSK